MSNFRIVAEKRGEATTGFRVQKGIFPRGYNYDTEKLRSPVWRNKGRKVYTVNDARDLQRFYEHEADVTAPSITYEEVLY